MAAVRVSVITKSPALRAGLSAWLQEAGFEVTRSLESASLGTIEQAADVVIVDAATASLQRYASRAPAVVLITTEAQDVRTLRALRSRGWAAIEPTCTRDEFIAAVGAASAGLVALAAAFAAEAIPPRLTNKRAVPVLTRRERAVLDRMARGLLSKQIAQELGIAESTVKFHLSSIYAKLGANNRAEAILRAVQLGLLSI